MLKTPEIVLAVALPIEARAFAPLFAKGQPIQGAGVSGIGGEISGVPTWLIETGVGPHAAARIARKIAEIGPKALISTGLAGALSPAIRPGSLILAHEVRDEGNLKGSGLKPPPALLATARAAIGGSRISVSTGILLTVSAPVTRPKDKIRMGKESGAIAVDMESAPLLQITAEYEIPALVLRGVSDGAHDTLPDFTNRDPATWRGQLAIAAEAIPSPKKLRNLIGIARGTRRALQSLSAAHAVLVPALARTIRES